jgi:hypothetical protein
VVVKRLLAALVEGAAKQLKQLLEIPRWKGDTNEDGLAFDKLGALARKRHLARAAEPLDHTAQARIDLAGHVWHDHLAEMVLDRDAIAFLQPILDLGEDRTIDDRIGGCRWRHSGLLLFEH